MCQVTYTSMPVLLNGFNYQVLNTYGEKSVGVIQVIN